MREVLAYVFALPGCVLHEAYSRPDNALRPFTTLESVTSAFDVATEEVYVMLHSPEMHGRVTERRIDLRAGAIPGATLRFAVEGSGLIQLILRAPLRGKLRASHTNHNSEARARASAQVSTAAAGDFASWDWKAVHRISSRLNRFMRANGVAKHLGRPVLRCAEDERAAGSIELVM